MTFPIGFDNYIEIELPLDFLSYWRNSQITNLIKNDRLVLPIRREDYSIVTEGKGIKRKRGYAKTFVDRETKYIGFRAKIRDQREDLRIAIEELANYSVSDDGDCTKIKTINLIDYHYRKDRTDRDRGYRLRTGIFEGEISQVVGSVTQGYIDCEGDRIIKGGKYGGAFSFKFMEATPVSFF